MAEMQQVPSVQMQPDGKEPIGTIELAPEVLEVIAGIATNEVKNVGQTRGNFATDVVERFGKKVHGKGVKTDWSEEGLCVSVYCSVKFGASIPDVAKEIQKRIRQAIFDMTSIRTREVNVHVTAIEFDTGRESAN